jgi:metallo-beta-lactamase family protein
VAELTFSGAAGTVTGSKHLLATGGKHLFIDCGMYQGTKNVTALNAAPLPVPAAQIDAVVLTHGHIDHVGYLPKLVRDGFRGPIFCTPATQGLLAIVLADAAHLQEHMTRRGFHAERDRLLPPFYDSKDVAATLPLARAVPLETDFARCGATFRFHNAGHILGSAFVDAHVEGKRVIFSGDMGRYDRPLLFDPTPLEAADEIVCEATYGDRDHPPDALGDLERALLTAIERGGPVVIPAFAVERTQDMLYSIGVLQARNPKLADLPVHVDSPMAIEVDALFARYPDAHKPFVDKPGAPFGCRHLRVHVSADESKELDALDAPGVIVSASGMASGGRVLHHLHRRIPDPNATIVFVGFQSPGTLGNLLVHGAQYVRIYGDQVPVRAGIVDLAGFSAHADRNDLLRWLGTLHDKPHLYAVHAEPESAAHFVATVTERLGFRADVARRGETVSL